MPTYLCHGFRWQRRSIRVFVIVQNLDDAAPEWVIRRGTARALLQAFYALFDFLPYSPPPPLHTPAPAAAADDDSTAHPSYPVSNGRSRAGSEARSRSRSKSASRRSSSATATQQQQHQQPARPYPSAEQWHSQALRDADDDVLSQEWSAVKVLEEYDPLNLDEVSRPHAYVADFVQRIDLSCGVAEAMARYEERLRGDPEPAMGAGGPSDETGRGGGGGGGKHGRRGAGGWLEKLRDQLQRGEEIRWYVVVNGDEERDWPSDRPVRPDPRVPVPSRRQQEHHAQYMMQQGIFESGDREREKARERLRVELGGDKDILNDRRGASRDRGGGPGSDFSHRDRERERRGPDRRPVVPEKDAGPRLRTRLSTDHGLRPKTPSKAGGFRRLFGRAKADEYS